MCAACTGFFFNPLPHHLLACSSIGNAKDKHCKNAPDNVVFHGYTEDEALNDVLSRTRIFMAPIMVSTGVATKIVKAMQHGAQACRTVMP